MIQIENIISRFNSNAKMINSLLEDVPQRQVTWKLSPGKWSLLKVVNHLVDEEKEDFWQRLDYTLNRRGKVWPGIDPPA